MINELYKDITEATTGIIAHGVNCQRAMGSGVALAIKTKWPLIYEMYMVSSTGLGDADVIEVDNMLYVANCYTQEFFGSGGRYASPEAIASSLRTVYETATLYNMDVNLPKIGSDRGGLDWETEVLPIITSLDDEFEDVTTNLYIWK